MLLNLQKSNVLYSYLGAFRSCLTTIPLNEERTYSKQIIFRAKEGCNPDIEHVDDLNTL